MGAQIKSPIQMTFDDWFGMSRKPISPKFENGETVYIRSLDVVLEGVVNHSYICGENENPYYGYSVDFERLHTSVWDYLIGNTVFKTKEEALNKISSLYFEKIEPEQLAISELKAFEYIRELDKYRLTATLGKVGECQLYESEFMCYHFLRSYPTPEKRDEAYKRLLKKMKTECAENSGNETAPVFETLYKVSSEVYASRGYAEHNGVKGTLL